MSRPRATSVRCVIKMPVSGKRTRDATNRISLNVTGIFCGKLSRCPAGDSCQQSASQEIRANTGFLPTHAVNRRAGMAALQQMPAGLSRMKIKTGAESKDHSGDTTDRVK